MNAMKNAVRNASNATKEGLAKLVKPRDKAKGNKTLTKKNARAQRKARLTPPAAEYVEEQKAKPAETTPTGFDISSYARGLLARAIRNVRENDGAKLPDEAAAAEIAARAGLLDACNGDLAIALSCIVEVGDDPQQSGQSCYSLCYAIMKSVCFFANLDLRRWLDPHGDHDVASFYADRREEHRDPPLGLQREVDDEFSDATIIDAVRDINVMLTASAEAFGWQDQRGAGIPYAVEMHSDGTFQQYHDALAALDYTERQRQVRRAKQRDQRTAQNARAAALARKQMKGVLAAAQS